MQFDTMDPATEPAGVAGLNIQISFKHLFVDKYFHSKIPSCIQKYKVFQNQYRRL